MYCALVILIIRFQMLFLGKEVLINAVARRQKNCLAILLKSFGAILGEGIHFKGNIQLDNVYEDQESTGDFSRLKFGKGCVIGSNAFFDLTDQITLEDQVGIGAHSMLMTHMDLGKMPMSAIYPRVRGPIYIGSGCFLGAHVIVLSGVKLGKNCVVAAGSVITESFPDYSLIAGVPARKIRSLDPDLPDMV